MCHPDAGPHRPGQAVRRDEVAVPLRDGGTMPALVVRPDDDTPAPAVVVLVDIYGRSAFYEQLAAVLAEQGFVAVVPEPFHREGPLPERTFPAAAARRAQWSEARGVGDYDDVATWLRGRADVRGARIGTVGCCLGGTLALHLAATRGDLATVCFYGFPGGSGPGGLPAPNERVGDLRGRVLAFWGDRDERVGMDNVAAFAARADDHGVDLEHTVYPGLDHGFLAALFDEAADGQAEAREAWDRTVAFLRKDLVDAS